MHTISILRQIFSRYYRHIVLLAVLGFLGGMLEGIGVNALIPLLSFLVGGGQNAGTDAISHLIRALFGFFSVEFKFRNLCFFILGLFLIRSGVLVVTNYIRGAVAADFLNRETSRLFRLLLESRWPFLLKQKLGYLQNTLVRDIPRSADLFSAISQVIQSMTGFLMYLVVAVNVSWKVTLGAVAAGGMFLLLLKPITKRIQRYGTLYITEEKIAAQHFSEHIIGMKVVKASGREDEIARRGDGFLATLKGLYKKNTLIRSVSSSLIQPFSLIFALAVLAIMYKSPGFNIASFAVIIYLIQKIFTYLDSGQNAIQFTIESVPYAANVVAFRDALTKEAERGWIGEGDKAFAFSRSLDFKDISFGYTGDRRVLSGVSFSIKRGETIGLVGPSGAGKTSIADLILRLFRPESGGILIDGTPAEATDLMDWRRHISYVPQEIFLINGTIEDNIRFYRDDVSDEAIIAATKQSHIYDFIAGLPDGFKTVTGDRGVMLSGGQRQRIALARALVRLPDILILDEATSALDHESEALIHQAIQELHNKVTVIIIAHRLSTVMNADRIFVLENGVIAESGTPAELNNDPVSYLHKNHGA